MLSYVAIALVEVQLAYVAPRPFLMAYMVNYPHQTEITIYTSTAYSE